MIALLKSLVYTVSTQDYSGFPEFQNILPTPILQGLYRDYYQSGSGRVALLFFLTLIFFEALVGRGRTSWLAKSFFTVLFFFYITTHQFTFRSTTIPLNIFFLPVPKISPFILFLLLAPIGAFAVSNFRARVRTLFQAHIGFIFDLVLAACTLLLFLPALTGEIFFYT